MATKISSKHLTEDWKSIKMRSCSGGFADCCWLATTPISGCICHNKPLHLPPNFQQAKQWREATISGSRETAKRSEIGVSFRNTNRRFEEAAERRGGREYPVRNGAGRTMAAPVEDRMKHCFVGWARVASGKRLRKKSATLLPQKNVYGRAFGWQRLMLGRRSRLAVRITLRRRHYRRAVGDGCGVAALLKKRRRKKKKNYTKLK